MVRLTTGLAVLALTLLRLDTVWAAATQAQIQACAETIEFSSYEEEVTYSTADTTKYNVTYTYSVSACTTVGVAVNSIYLMDEDTPATYSCTLVQFSSTGSLFTTCSVTHGAMATAAIGGAVDWADFIKIGQKPTYYTIENDFTVNGYTPPTPSGNARRRRALQEHPQFEVQVPDLEPQVTCPPGFSSCWTGVRDQFECINTSGDVTACGGCPMSSFAQDCTSISGSNEVQCVAAACKVVSCDAYHTLSPDGTSCVPNGRRKRSVYSRR